MRILASVVQHVLWNGSSSPVGELVSFVDGDMAVFLKDVRQRNALFLNVC